MNIRNTFIAAFFAAAAAVVLTPSASWAQSGDQSSASHVQSADVLPASWAQPEEDPEDVIIIIIIAEGGEGE